MNATAHARPTTRSTRVTALPDIPGITARLTLTSVSRTRASTEYASTKKTDTSASAHLVMVHLYKNLKGHVIGSLLDLFVCLFVLSVCHSFSQSVSMYVFRFI